MGPKKSDPAKDENYWRILIEDTPLNDDFWSVQVVMIEVAGSDQDRMYLNKFEVFAAEEKRFVVKNICKTETMFMINQLGGERKVKDENLRVFEIGQSFLKDKKDIPPEIQALVVKHLILKMKEEYLFIQKQQLYVRDGMRRESATMIDKAEVRGTVCVPASQPTTPLSQRQGKSKKGEPEPVVADEPEEGKKYNTSLRVRGEEWRDKVYVDDYPLDGPNLYVAVSGFMEPLLAGCLIKIGVPLTAIFQIRIDLASQPVPQSLTRPSKRGQSQTDVFIGQSQKFWDDVQQLRINKDTANDYNNTAFVVFSPPYWTADELSGNADKIYDELCFLMYDIQDLIRQRSNYLENMHIVNIPAEPIDMSYKITYEKLIDGLPLECCSTYSILDSILEAVCKKHELTDSLSSNTHVSDDITFNQPSIPIEDDKMKNAETLVNDVFNALNSTYSNKKSYRLTYGDEFENHKDPIVINFADYAKYQTFHLADVNLDSIVYSMLLGMPVNRLWYGQKRPEDELEAKINFHVNVLLSCFDRSDVETTELNRLMHILSCKKLYNNRSSLKKNHVASLTISEFKRLYLRRTALAEPLPKITPLVMSSITTPHSFPSITKVENTSSILTSSADSEERKVECLFECPDISELVSPSEVANNAPNDHIIDDFEVFEDYSETRAFQILREAFSNFNCLDYKYCEVTDTFNLMFFNSHDHDGIAREEWRSHLATPVCLQDFFDFVLEEHYDWIQNEEKFYEQKLVQDSQSLCAAVDPLALQSCIENQDVDMEMLIEGSLKYKEFHEIEGIEEQSAISSTNKKSDGVSAAPTSRVGDTKSSKRTKTTAVSSPLTSHKGIGSDILIPPIVFQGYDLGERRVEVFGKDDTFYSKDGTRVSSRYSFIIPMNLENIILNVVPGNTFNEFWVHKSIGESVSTDVSDACESFRITSKDQVAFNFKKESYLHPIPMTGSLLDNTTEGKAKETAPKVPSEVETDALAELKTFHSLCVTWPNGHVTESVHEQNSSDLSHIKQSYVVPGPLPDEEMRCISLNGEVIIFKVSGLIEVLRSDGTYINITKYGKRIIASEVTEEPPVIEKTTKGSAKTQRNEKQTPKNILLEQENATTSILPTPEYELFIDEFEIIETSGLRQQWVEDRPYDIEKLLIRTATDYCLGEVYSRRMDGTKILLNKDGVQIVTFPNQTRIITRLIVEDQEIYPEWTEEEIYAYDLIGSLELSETFLSQKSYISRVSKLSRLQSYQSMSKKTLEEDRKQATQRTDGYISLHITYTIEHENYTSVTVNKANGEVTISSPNNSGVTLSNDKQYEINLDPATVATFNGQDLKIDYSGCTECNSKTSCKIKICQDDIITLGKQQQRWLSMEDSFGKKIIVNEEGTIMLDNRKPQLNTFLLDGETQASAVQIEETEVKSGSRVPSNTSALVHGKCREMYSAKEMRFFILRRDLTCSELVHRLQLEQDVKACRFQPWCSINEYETFGDRRSLLVMLSPVALTESEKWVMRSQLSSKARSLKYKDLKKDCGKGFYHWMRPYERFVPKSQSFDGTTPRLPRAFISRILEKQWKERHRKHLKGARELSRAVLKYRRVMESDCASNLRLPVVDSRSEHEKRVHDLVQALGHRVYQELKARLDQSVANNVKADITTKPLPEKHEETEFEAKEGLAEPLQTLDQEREASVQEAQVVEASPNLKRYWRRREEERKEQEFYLHLLREGIVPPYFRNVLGGAIWWEVNNTAGAAVDRAERRKVKCVCDEASSRTDTLPFM